MNNNTTHIVQSMYTLLAVFALSVLGTNVNATTIWYVDADASGGGNGTSWANAFNDLQDALEAAEISTGNDQIWVAEGTYVPSVAFFGSLPSFAMLNDVALYGGFKGNELLLTKRDPENNITTLSGDINQDDNGTGHNKSDNVNRVVWAYQVDSTAVLDGFRIADGYAQTSGDNVSGGGMVIIEASPKVVRCVFDGNQGGCGGGVFMDNNGMDVDDMVFLNCKFTGNVGKPGGGIAIVKQGVSSSPGKVEMHNCLFSGNVSENNGGGLVFSGFDGIDPIGSMSLINCTFANNDAVFDGGSIWVSGRMRVSNSILWDNSDIGGQDSSAQIHNTGAAGVSVTYSDVEGGWLGSGSGNINADPKYQDPDGIDNLIGTLDDNLRLQVTSPCIDTGRNTYLPTDVCDIDSDGNTTESLPWDLDTNKRIIDGDIVPGARVDMGPFEFLFSL